MNYDEIRERYERERMMARQANQTNKAAVFDALSGGGFTSVVVTFDGCGDDGQIEDITALREETVVELGPIPVMICGKGSSLNEPKERFDPLPEAIETLCYELLEQEYEGWENSDGVLDGAFGEFRFDVNKRVIELDFNQRHIAVEEYNNIF